MMKTDITKIIGYILLTPVIFSVLGFWWDLYDGSIIPGITNLYDTTWIGYGESFTPALPFYFGLMAIAGAYLIKDNKK